MKRLAQVVICNAMIIMALIVQPYSAHAAVGEPKIGSAAAIIMDAETGDVLWEKNADEKRAMASTTKMMTAILTLERESLEATVTIGDDILSANRYGIKLSVGEQMRVESLLYALMLSSANDSAVALAGHVGGSQERFAELMNKKAFRIGAYNTHYTNPHGLDDPKHYSTARDLALIARYGMNNKKFASIVATKKWELNRVDKKKPYIVENRNKLLWTYPLATGIKTGQTSRAGNCLVSAAETDTVSIISVILGAKSQEAVFRESKVLLDYGFSLYEKKKLISKETIYKTIWMKYGEKVNLVAESDVEAFIRRSTATKVIIKADKKVDYPIKKGAVLGHITVLEAGRTVADAPLIAKKAVKKPNFTAIIGFYLNRLISAIF